jgi:hypothetical protein
LYRPERKVDWENCGDVPFMGHGMHNKIPSATGVLEQSPIQVFTRQNVA